MRPSGERVALVLRASDGPRIRVAALITVDGGLVLVRHRAGASTYHLLPGGGVRYRETLGDALVREVEEETGLQVRCGRPLLINDTIDPDGPRHVVNITFDATVTGGSLTHRPKDPRIEAVELVEADRLLTLDLRPPIAEAIAGILADPAGAQAAYLGPLFTPGGVVEVPDGKDGT